jgi:hypothetical protein
MESARKRGNRRTALELANEIRQSITRPAETDRTAQTMWDRVLGVFSRSEGTLAQLEVATATRDNGLSRYASGTSMYLLANLLRSGGRYDLARDWVTKAEATYWRGVPSHDTELAHCHYARQICTAVMGSSEFDPPKDEAELLSKRFSGALIILSYSHAAWFLGDIPRALHHAEQAATAFAAVEADRYILRARQLQELLRVWQALDASALPTFNGIDPHLAEAIRYFSGQQPTWPGLADWLEDQRPSMAVGLLQFARRTPQVWLRAQPLRLPYTIQVLADGMLRWTDPTLVHSLADADATLRRLMSIPTNQRIPLIAD